MLTDVIKRGTEQIDVIISEVSDYLKDGIGCQHTMLVALGQAFGMLKLLGDIEDAEAKRIRIQALMWDVSRKTAKD